MLCWVNAGRVVQSGMRGHNVLLQCQAFLQLLRCGKGRCRQRAVWVPTCVATRASSAGRRTVHCAMEIVMRSRFTGGRSHSHWMRPHVSCTGTQAHCAPTAGQHASGVKVWCPGSRVQALQGCAPLAGRQWLPPTWPVRSAQPDPQDSSAQHPARSSQQSAVVAVLYCSTVACKGAPNDYQLPCLQERCLAYISNIAGAVNAGPV